MASGDASQPSSTAPQVPCLIVLSGPLFGELFELPAGRPVTLGRDPGAEVLLHDEGVSPRHASLVLEGGGARLTDLGSQAGTFTGGRRVDEAVLAHGDRFQLGAHLTLALVTPDGADAGSLRALAAGARYEPLTGLANRRHFLERLGAELAAAQRHGRALALLLLDVDQLARVNGAHGPAAGDAVLRTVAGVLRAAVRKEDLVARSGGEELVVLARETGLSGAKTLAERIRRSVERARTAWQGRELAVTVSMGVTVSVGLTRFEPGRTEAELLGAAEGALQRAKQRGRNAVVAAPAMGGRP